jgi:4-hydroxy-tetrahydrodipicolinate synthase
MESVSGLLTATLTPFDDSGRVDLGVVRDHSRFLVDAGVDGLCPAGTTGEFLYLTLSEKIRVVEQTVAAATGRVPVVAGVWSLRQAEIDLLARAAEAAGASAVFLPPPIYYPATDDAIYAHYAAVRRATALPVFAYNIPAYAANAISIECLRRLAGDGVIAGIKDSSASPERMRALVAEFGDRLAVEAASDSFASEGRKIGAHGFISALANVWPAAFRRLWYGEESLQSAVDRVRSAVKHAGGIAALKHLAARRGFPFGTARLPYSLLTDSQKAALDAACDAATADGLA